MSKPKRKRKPNPKMLLYRTRCDRHQAIIDSQELDAYEKAVMQAITSHLLDDKLVCWPSQATLAKCASMTDRGVRKIIKRLCDREFLSVRGTSTIDTAILEINWSKLSIATKDGRFTLRGQSSIRRKKRPSQPTRGAEPGSGGVGTAFRGRSEPGSYERGTRGTRNKGNDNQTSEAPLSVSGSGLAAGKTERSASQAGGRNFPFLPAADAKGFARFILSWHEKLPHAPRFDKSDAFPWARAWETHSTLRDLAFMLLEAIVADDYRAGRKEDSHGKRFVMLPLWLLGEQEGKQRWRLFLDEKHGPKLGSVYWAYRKLMDDPHKRYSADRLQECVANLRQQADFQKISLRDALENPKMVKTALGCFGVMEWSQETETEFRTLAMQLHERLAARREPTKDEIEANFEAEIARLQAIAEMRAEQAQPTTYSEADGADHDQEHTHEAKRNHGRRREAGAEHQRK